MGLIGFIRSNLPESWEKASKELRMKDELVHRLYDAIPHSFKNRYHYKEAIEHLKRKFACRTSIYYLVEATDLDLDKWKKLDDRINQIKEECK